MHPLVFPKRKNIINSTDQTLFLFLSPYAFNISQIDARSPPFLKSSKSFNAHVRLIFSQTDNTA
jgi:hypothetical protein